MRLSFPALTSLYGQQRTDEEHHHRVKGYPLKIMNLLLTILLTALHVLKSTAYPTEPALECPTDCICYSDYLHNLESWRWVEIDLFNDAEDPEHERFNPFLEHNEVFENPKLHRKRQRESQLSTVTCMIRTNDSDQLDALFHSISPQTQVLSLLQAPGTGSVLLTTSHFLRFQSLVGLELSGYSDSPNSLEVSGDCFTSLHKLTYLSLDKVSLLHNSVENDLPFGNSKYLRINYTFNDVETNELTSQILLISPDEDPTPDVIPYSEYRKNIDEKPAPLQPTFRVAFTGLPKLQHLKMSGCSLHDISWDMFYKLESLKYLILEENDLLFLPDFAFYATTNLTALSLSRNRILNLQTVGLAGLLFLQKLDVSHNNITHLSELSLPPFPHLEVADFRHNPISAIFPNTFEIMNSTKALYLGSGNTPLDLSPNSFYGLVSLTKLDITNVKIRLLEKTMLRGMPQLRTLIMTGNIPRISYDAFGDVLNLERLILRNCGLRKISMDAFFGLAALAELDLSHNSLSFLPPGIFEEQTNLKEVFLQYNQLKTLPVNLVKDLPIKILRLEGNPWHCSCDMRSWNPQIVNRVKRYHIPPPNDTLCQRAYDKGSMCFEKYEPKFEVTYGYEKRVSPVCETPLKFGNRSVFQVMRKELKYCSSTGTEEGDTSTTVPDLGVVRLNPWPDSFSLDTLKALEKQLLAKPVKVKKNKTMTGNNDENNLIVNSILPLPQLPALETRQEGMTEQSIVIETHKTAKVESTTVTPPEAVPLLQLKSRGKGKKKNKNRVAATHESERNMPSISKKAMKLAKLLKKQSLQL